LTHWIGAHGRVKLAKSCENTLTRDVHHREPETQNEKRFFQSKLEEIPKPYMVWTTFWLYRWKLWLNKVRATTVVLRFLKAF